MKDHQVLDFYDTLFVHSTNKEHLAQSNRRCLTQERVAIVNLDKTNLLQMINVKRLTKHQSKNQRVVPIKFYDKIHNNRQNSLFCEQINQSDKYSSLKKLDKLLTEVRKIPYNLNKLKKIQIINSHQCYIQQSNQHVYFTKIILLEQNVQDNINNQQTKTFKSKIQQFQNAGQLSIFKQISLYFNFGSLQPIFLQSKNQNSKILLKFSTLEDFLWIAIILERLHLITQNIQFIIDQNNSIIQQCPLVFKNLALNLNLKIQQIQEPIRVCLDSNYLMRGTCHEFQLLSNDQQKNRLKQQLIIQPILNYFSIQIKPNLFVNCSIQKKHIQSIQYILKQFQLKRIIIGSQKQQTYNMLFKIQKQTQKISKIMVFGMGCYYLINCLRVMIKKQYHFEQIIDALSQELSLDDLIETYEVALTNQFPKL